MSKTVSSGSVVIKFSELELEDLSVDEVEQEIIDQVSDVLNRWMAFSNVVTDVRVTDLVTETLQKVARIQLRMDTTVDVSYDPDEWDISSWADDNAQALIENAAENGSYEVFVSDEDTGINPSRVDFDVSDL